MNNETDGTTFREIMEWQAAYKKEPILHARFVVTRDDAPNEVIDGPWDEVQDHPALSLTRTIPEGLQGMGLEWTPFFAWTENWLLVFRPETDEDYAGFVAYPRSP